MVTRAAFSRLSRPLVLAVLVTGGIAPTAAAVAHAQAPTTLPKQIFARYSNAGARYSITYPTAWQHIANSAVDFMAGAADRHAFVTASATSLNGSTVSAAEITAQQKHVLQQDHLIAGTMTLDTKYIGGVRFEVAEGLTHAGNQVLDTIILDGVSHGYLYDFGAGVVLKTRSTAGETKLVLQSLNSISIH